MKPLTAKDAKYGFGRLIDLARTEPLMMAKHRRPVVAVEEYERLKVLDERSAGNTAQSAKAEKRTGA